ncbi:MAG: Aspartate aminotransferase [Bacteroidetes bacterium ADurb.Bin141]|nr:MAG: Aspartate aminotransferase [Bacteroidetes bacterium ADurb.Bin141]
MEDIIEKTEARTASLMAETLIGSEIIKLAAEVNEKIKQGATVHNLTIGDFNPAIFPIPDDLKNEIIQAYQQGITNYPAANGQPELRKAVSAYIKKYQKLDYSANEILISGGARPLIYAIYKTIIDPGDKVIFPIPSWNNNHYCHLSQAQPVAIETLPQNNFMPNASELKEHISSAALVALCSPQNPTGTVFSKEQLNDICELIIAENKKRKNKKPLYLMYDQIYMALTFGNTRHVDPVSLHPELRPYTIYVDGLSKAFSATGLRVGWAFGPETIIEKMKSILSHVGAWSPKPEQVATAHFLSKEHVVDNFLIHYKSEVEKRLNAFYDGFTQLKKEGLPVDVIDPQAAIYLTVQINILNKKLPDGSRIRNSADITSFLINHAQVALVPFSAFGASETSAWFRLSVGTAHMQDISSIFKNLRAALAKLTN